MDIIIQKLTADLEEAYLDFFDHQAFSDGSPNAPCYCCAYNLSSIEIDAELIRRAQALGGGEESWKRAQREAASRMVREGRLNGYLAFDRGQAVGWCNAGDRKSYFRVGAFDLSDLPPDEPPLPIDRGVIRSVVCFEVAPPYRGRGIASLLLDRVCRDAEKEGCLWVEGYPPAGDVGSASAYAGPMRLYEKAGFELFRQIGNTLVMRKKLK